MNSSFFSDISKLFFRHGQTFAIVLIAFLFLLFVPLFQRGIFFWDAFCIIAIVLFPWNKYLDKSGKWLIAWSFSFGVMLFLTNGAYTSSSIILNFSAPIVLYAIGGWFVDKLNCDEKELIILLFLSIFSFSLVLWYRIVMDISINGLISGLRTIENEGENEFGATLYGLYAAVAMVGIPLFVTTRRSWKSLLMWLFLCMAFLSIISTIHLINRTAFVVLLLCAVVIIIYRSKINIFKSVLFIALIAGVLYAIFNYSLIGDDIKTVYEFRNNESDIATAGSRSHRWIDAVSRIFYMPFGWYGKEVITGYHYVHNWWLDVGRQAGLFSFIALIVPTIISIKTILKLFLRKRSVLVALLIGLNVCLFAAAFVEPVMEGSSFFAYYYIFIWGVQNRYFKQTTIV